MDKAKKNLSLGRFRPEEKIKRGSTCVVLGKRRSGKTILQRQLLHDLYKDRGRVVVFTGSEEGKEFFPQFVDDSYIYDGFPDEVIDRCFHGQKQQKRKYGGKREGKEEGPAPPDLDMACVLEDLSFDTKVMKSKQLSELFHNGRHMNMTVIMAVQYVMSMPPKIRSNIDYVFIFKDNNVMNRRNIHKSWGGVINSFVEFDEIMQAVTDDHRCMVIDNTSQKSSPDQCLYWYKARVDLPPFRVGCRDYQLAHQLYRASQRAAEAESDEGVLQRKGAEEEPAEEADPLGEFAPKFDTLSDLEGNRYCRYQLTKQNLVLQSFDEEEEGSIGESPAAATQAIAKGDRAGASGPGESVRPDAGGTGPPAPEPRPPSPNEQAES